MIELQPETSPTDQITIIELLLKGGIVMIPIFLLLLIATYVAIERYLYLRTATRRKNDFIPHLKKCLLDGDIKTARVLAEQQQTTATAAVITHALDYIGKPFKEIESMMESAANLEVARMEKNMGYLGIIAGVAPMLGFIGTITGIIRIFYTISLADNISIGIIAGGLYEKMITSGSGLVVGVIAYAAYHLLHQKIQRFTLHMQEDTLDFLRIITTAQR